MHARTFVLLIALALLPAADVLAQRPDMGGRGDRGDHGPGRGGYDGPGRGGPGYGGPGRGGGPGYGGGGPGYGRPPMTPSPGGRQPGQPQPGAPQPGGPRPGGPPHGGPQPGGSSSSSEDYARERAARMETYLKSFDANGDGTIDPSEVKDERQQRMLGYIGQRYGFEPGKPIQLSKLKEAVTKQSSQSRGESDKGKKDEKEEDQPPLVPGFGVDREDAPSIPRFGQRVGRQLIGVTKADSPAAKPPAKPAEHRDRKDDSQAKFRDYANSVLKKHDKNHNGRLDRDEWEGVKPDPQTADRDRNGIVTLDELTNALVAFSKGQKPGDDWAASNPYRAMTRWERLPDELPDSDRFMELDVNGDGQVAMSEFAVAWDDSKAMEFVSMDQNNDGLITPQEWIAADAMPEEERLASVDISAASQGRSALTRGAAPQPRSPSPAAKPTPPAVKPGGPTEEEPKAKNWWD